MSHDLTIHAARWCKSNVAWHRSVPSSSGKTVYEVTWGLTPGGPYQYGYSCTCLAFKHGKGAKCKHIREVAHERCAYGWEAAAGSPTEMGDTCPECGGETVGMRYGA